MATVNPLGTGHEAVQDRNIVVPITGSAGVLANHGDAAQWNWGWLNGI